MILATLCYVKCGGKTLMLHRNKRENDFHDGRWNGLGGKMELHETPEECVIREVREESGLVIRDPHLRGILTFPEFSPDQDCPSATLKEKAFLKGSAGTAVSFNPKSLSGADDWYVYVFTADQFEGELIDSDEGTLEWIPDEKLAKLHLWEGDPIFLKWLEEGRFFSGKFVYRNQKLIEHSVVFYPVRSKIS